MADEQKPMTRDRFRQEAAIACAAHYCDNKHAIEQADRLTDAMFGPEDPRNDDALIERVVREVSHIWPQPLEDAEYHQLKSAVTRAVKEGG